MALLTFSIDVLVPEPDEDTLSGLVGVTEAQAALFMSALNEVLERADYEPAIDYYIGDPVHPPVRDCECDGPPGWHCEGEDATHWPDTDGVTCGYCGWAPDPVVLA